MAFYTRPLNPILGNLVTAEQFAKALQAIDDYRDDADTPVHGRNFWIPDEQMRQLSVALSEEICRRFDVVPNGTLQSPDKPQKPDLGTWLNRYNN